MLVQLQCVSGILFSLIDKNGVDEHQGLGDMDENVITIRINVISLFLSSFKADFCS